MMQEVELSVIIPVKNVERIIGGILRSVVHQISSLQAECIVVDMNSKDRTVLEAYQLSKELKVKGCVVRSGEPSLSVALNTGIQKAAGQYVSFLFLHQLHRDFFPGYLETARQGADVVFGCATSSEVKVADRRVRSSVVRQMTGADFAAEWIRGNTSVNPAAFLVRRRFLEQNQIHFQEKASWGFTEEFVFRCLFCADLTLQSPTVPVLDEVFEVRSGDFLPEDHPASGTKIVGKEIFDAVDLMIQASDFARLRHQEHEELQKQFLYQKLPSTVMSCVDFLLRQGMTHQAVKGFLKRGNYHNLLRTDGKFTDAELKRRVGLWKKFSWMYKPKG